MNYQAFTNDSLTMMYEGIRGASNPTINLLALARNRGFVSAKLTNGSCMPQISKLKCTSAA
jgi:hypothetical protein